MLWRLRWNYLHRRRTEQQVNAFWTPLHVKGPPVLGGGGEGKDERGQRFERGDDRRERRDERSARDVDSSPVRLCMPAS